jgi:flagellar biosynthesis GTPase FlhF
MNELPLPKPMASKSEEGGRKSQNIDDDHEGDWMSQEIKKLQSQLDELMKENSVLKKRLEKKNYEQVFVENEQLQLELKNMYFLLEENKDLKEELARLKNISYDQKVKEINQENTLLRKRNGHLLIQNEELQQTISDLKT